MRAIVECIKGSKIRNEVMPSGYIQSFDIKKPWVESYGYIKGTLQADGDALDCYILGKDLAVGDEVDVAAVAAIVCIDNGCRDDKFICIKSGYKTSAKRIDRTIKKLVRIIRKYKKGTIVVGVRRTAGWMYYELLKCRTYKKLFSKGE